VTLSSTQVRRGRGRGYAAIPRANRQTDPLTYRGYPVQELCRRHSFEEVAFLLWHGELPTREEMSAQNRAERPWRSLDPDLAAVLAGQPFGAPPMDSLRTAVSALGAKAPAKRDVTAGTIHAEALRLFAVLPSLIAFEQRRRHGLGLVAPRDDLGYAANFLYMTFGKVPEPQVVAAFDRSLILYAGESIRVPAVTDRAATASLHGLYSAVATAVGALKGSAQGTAIGTVMEMMNDVAIPDNARSWVDEARAKGRCVAAFGPFSARNGDAGVLAMRTALGMVAAIRGGHLLIETYEALAAAMFEATGLRPNLSCPTGIAYHLTGFDPQLFAPILAAACLPGWTAQVGGQLTASGIARPRIASDDQAAGNLAWEG
jgi:citrate synthase